MQTLTKDQRKAVHCLWLRAKAGDNPEARTYREFRKSCVPMFDKSGGIMIPLWGMWLGIEKDGYTHS